MFFANAFPALSELVCDCGDDKNINNPKYSSVLKDLNPSIWKYEIIYLALSIIYLLGPSYKLL